jgi:mRNA-degrading endonuclease toxin of MazEF toxin-antitoxin module
VPKLEQGRIVRVEICDPSGRNPKRRPVVIVHPTEKIKPDEPIYCVAITGEIPKKVPDNCILLPYQLGGHPRTGLRKRCAALCSWVVKITEDEIVEYLGIVPKSRLDAILAEVAITE